MTPALREKVMKGHGICLPSSLSSKAMESGETLGVGNAKTVKEKIKEDSVAQITYSVLGFPTPPSSLQSNLFDLKCFASQSSKHYPILTNSNSSPSIYNKHCMQRSGEEQNCSRMRNPLYNSANTHFGQILNSETREGESLLGAAMQNSSEMGKPSEPRLTASSRAEERQLPNSKWQWKNGFLGKPISINTEMKEGKVFHHCEAPETKIDSGSCSKEQELNFRLLQCVNKQQALLSRAKRTQKHLQILLAKHVVKLCDQQMRCFVRHQLQRMKAFHNPNRMSDGSCHRYAGIKTESNNPEASVSKHLQRDFTFVPGEIQLFARSTTGLLSQVEKSLDSDATCSSSSEDDDEQVSRTAVAKLSKYRSDWQWLADRAKIGCRWTWLQAQISEIEYKIQQLTDLHRQIRATKGMVTLEELPTPKDVLKKQTQPADKEALLHTAGNSQAHPLRQDAWPENDFEMSPSSPTLLLQNIEKQSAQLSEIISSLMAPFSLSPTSSPLSSKPCRQKDTVNGISLRGAGTAEEISSSSSWLIDQQHLKRRRKDKTRLRASSVLVVSTSARTRPVQSFQRRKLYKMKTDFDWNQQATALRDDLLHSTTEKVVPSGAWNSYKNRSKQFMLELDSSFHPILSFPSDIPLHVHLKALLQKCDLKGDPFETATLGLEFEMSPSDECSQYKASQQWSCGHPSSSNHQPLSEITVQLPEGRKKRHLSETAIGDGHHRFEAFPIQQEQESHNHFTGTTSSEVSRSSDGASSQLTSRRRLRSESSYDIDNIVIPMSLVAPSKLEKLQYKEILTPSWRTASFVPLPSLHEDEGKVEDLSDEAFSSRHAKYEEKEQARWSLWEQCQWPKRNRTYSRNSEGYDTAMKHDNSDLVYQFGEATVDTSEADGSLCSSIPFERSQESILWERRTFPLKEEEAEVLLCQEQMPVQHESSARPTDNDSDCVLPGAFCLPNCHELHKKRSAEELADGNQVALGTGGPRRQR
ncbi:KAT8 regulatory NSL complex subunit 1-like protein [Heteronotia binoei]|uniref:KAT8 regulatory NSL complex subunit 1-like protein n=1 Tax=Heteronotia binoei TaxID=13085 RepID=UPI002931514F|nr:KAT8 regulatory NSL complex subunit 1-like protein [Heteronotia binoei]